MIPISINPFFIGLFFFFCPSLFGQAKEVGCVEGNCTKGNGTMLYPDGSRYTGEFSNSMHHGYGIFQYANGDKYSGFWKKNAPYGNGTYLWANGMKYVGGFKKDEYDGYGILYDSTGVILKKGIFKNNKLVSEK